MLCYIIDIIFHASGKTSVPLARYRFEADALGGDEASVDRSDDRNDSASTDDSGDAACANQQMNQGDGQNDEKALIDFDPKNPKYKCNKNRNAEDKNRRH